jgi:hypothetical protein
VSGVVLAWISWLSSDCFLLFYPYPGLRARVAELKMELSSVQGTLVAADDEHSELRAAAGLLCDALGVVPTRAWEVPMRERLSLVFEQV